VLLVTIRRVSVLTAAYKPKSATVRDESRRCTEVRWGTKSVDVKIG